MYTPEYLGLLRVAGGPGHSPRGDLELPAAGGSDPRRCPAHPPAQACYRLTIYIVSSFNIKVKILFLRNTKCIYHFIASFLYRKNVILRKVFESFWLFHPTVLWLSRRLDDVKKIIRNRLRGTEHVPEFPAGRGGWLDKSVCRVQPPGGAQSHRQAANCCSRQPGSDCLL